MAQNNNKQQDEDLLTPRQKLYGGLILGGIVILGGAATYVGVRHKVKSAISKKKQEVYTNKVGTETPQGYAAEYAQRLKSAMHSSYSWMPDGTDEESMFKVAAEMHKSQTSFAQVAKAYESIFARSLVEDMESELDSSDYENFMYALRSGVINGLGRVHNVNYGNIRF